MAVIEITKENFEQEVVGSPVPVVIDFWASWCGPCMMQGPIIEEVAEEMGDKVKVCKVNVDDQAGLAMEYRVANIPTLVFMNEGMCKDRAVGLQDKESIIAHLNSML